MQDDTPAVRELSDMDKAVISKRLDALRADYPVIALRLLMADGTEWKVGQFPEPAPAVAAQPAKPKRTRRRSITELGLVSKLAMPWVKLLMDYPGEVLTIRTHEFPGIELKQAQSALPSLINNMTGQKHTCSTVSRFDTTTQEFVVYAVYHPEPGRAVTILRGLGYRPAKNAHQFHNPAPRAESSTSATSVPTITLPQGNLTPNGLYHHQ